MFTINMKDIREIQEKIIISSHNSKLGHKNCSSKNCLMLNNSLLDFWKDIITDNLKENDEIIIKSAQSFEETVKILENPLISLEKIEEIKEIQQRYLVVIGKCIINRLKLDKVVKNINNGKRN